MISCPYYSSTSFEVLVPLAVLYSFASHAYWHLTSPALGRSPPYTLPQSSSSGSVAIVTGSNTGIGFETARSLAVDYGYTVILACRSRDKAQKAADLISQEAAGKAVFLQPLDLSSLQSVRSFVEAVGENYDRVNILVNNAGRNSNEEEPTVDGLDALFQANFVGHYVLTRELLDKKLLTGRIVNLSSVMHHFVSPSHGLEEVAYWKEVARFGNSQGDLKYSLSKLAAILFSMELNRRYGDRVEAIAVNPGAV